MNKSYFTLRAALVASLFSTASAFALSTADQTVTFAVTAFSDIVVTGAPTLTVSGGTAGSAPSFVQDVTTSYAITTNDTGRKITAVIGGADPLAMPTGLTLSIGLASPGGVASSTGLQVLTLAPVDVVTGISTLNSTGNTITYKLSATSAAGVVATDSRTVTLTVTAGT